MGRKYTFKGHDRPYFLPFTVIPLHWRVRVVTQATGRRHCMTGVSTFVVIIILKDAFGGTFGNAFLKFLTYSPALIYVFFVEKTGLVFGNFSKSVSKQFLHRSVSILVLAFTASRLIVEVEVAITDGWDAYVQKLTDIFGLSVNLIKYPFTYLVVGPLVEETFFRGILLRKLSAINKFHALWFTSLLYAFAHLHEGLIVSSMCYSFALGYLLGWVMLKTNHLG